MKFVIFDHEVGSRRQEKVNKVPPIQFDREMQRGRLASPNGEQRVGVGTVIEEPGCAIREPAHTGEVEDDPILFLEASRI